MANLNGTSTNIPRIGNPAAKFLIGFFAGLCSTFLPRLIIVLNMAGDNSDIIVFDSAYVLCAVAFSLIVGLVVMILEWKVYIAPGKTFMTALSIPALLAGTFNTNSALNLSEELSRELDNQIQQESTIPINPVPHQFKLLSEQDSFEPKNSLAGFLGLSVKEAYAGDSNTACGDFLAFKMRSQLYMIVLDRRQTEDEARARAQQLRTTFPRAQVVQVGPNEYLVIYDDIGLPRSQALLRAEQIRRGHPDLSLKLELVPVPAGSQLLE